MPITSESDWAAALGTAGAPLILFKGSGTSKGAGTFHSLWAVAGVPAAGGTPATGAGQAYNSSTAGALPFTNAIGGEDCQIARLSVWGSTIGHLYLCDRLVGSSGLSGVVLTEQTVGTVALPRFTDGVGVEVWLEVYTPTGATSQAGTIRYTNTADVGNRTGSFTMPSSPVAGQLVPVFLQAGDLGIKSVQGVTIPVSTGTAGSFGVTLLKRITDHPLTGQAAAVANIQDGFQTGLPVVPNNACLFGIVACSATNTGTINGMITMTRT